MGGDGPGMYGIRVPPMASEHPGVSGVTMKVDYGEFTRTPKSFIRAHSWTRLVIPEPISASELSAVLSECGH